MAVQEDNVVDNEKREEEEVTVEPTPIPDGPRFKGTCKWFNVLKGFGFILMDDSNEEVFVHQSELQMRGFRSLENNARVAFSTRPGRRGLEAWHVTAENEGDEIQGSSVRPLGKKKNTLIRCFKCGGYGNHVAAKCKKITHDTKVCYQCKSEDHLVGNCPLRPHRNDQATA